jgi:protocatechuate 3,4-dioxygenase beta subunit
MTPTTDRPADQLEDHDRGLGLDLAALLGRRRLFGLGAGAAGLLALAACGSDSASSPTTAASSTTTASTAPAAPGGGPGGQPPGGGAPPNGGGTGASSSATTVDGVIPEETNGPYPADGSNGVNVLTESGIVRSDIRSSFGTSTTTAEGVAVTLSYVVVDVSTGDPVEGLAVYTWHCDRQGNYSMYSQAAADENYLRGVQATGSDGAATFTTIYPACYSGRWPHYHFEVYPSVDRATSGDSRLATSQIALPDDSNRAVFATSGYEQSVKNYAQVSLATDMVFSDGVELETPTVSGDVTSGYTITLKVPLST